MDSIGMIGVDLGKRSFQLHGVSGDGAAVFRRKVSRDRFLDEVTGHGRCTVAMEACGGGATGAGNCRRGVSRCFRFRRPM